MTQMNVLVTGDRKWTAAAVLDAALRSVSPDWVVSGGAQGADTIARNVCGAYEIPFVEVLAEWNLYKGGAGPIRNGKMLRMLLERDGDKLVLAFNDDLLGKSRGTKNMVRQALDKGVSVVLYESDWSAYDVVLVNGAMTKVWRGR